MLEEKIKKLKNYTILFVEDEDDIRLIISDTLSKLEIDFYLASNGKEALEVYNENPSINLIVSDINMPYMNGLEMLAKIREANDDVICIIMSAHTEKSYKTLANDLNVTQYMEKPFDFLKFIDFMDTL